MIDKRVRVSPTREHWVSQSGPGPDPVLQQDLGVGGVGGPPERLGFLGVVLPHTEDIPSDSACQIPKSNDLC